MIFTSFALVALAVISGVASYQQAKKMQEKMEDATRGVETNIESNIKAIPVVYGERRVGGVRVFIDTSKDRTNQHLYMAIVMAEGEVEDITDIYIDDIPITDEKFRLNPLSANLEYEVFTGTPNQPVSQLLKQGTSYSGNPDISNPEVAQYLLDNDPTGNFPWADDHRLQGVAYIALKFVWDQNAYSGVPDVTAIVKGKKVYDPRTQTTAWSNNPALCIRDYLTNPIYGKGISESAIDDVLFAQSANDIDNFTVIPYENADPIKLFELNMVVDTDKKIIENLNEMLLACRGFLPYSNGTYGLKIDQATNHVMDVDENHIIGGISIVGTKKEDRFNQVKVNFFNKDKEYKEDTAVFPDTDSTLYQTYLTEDSGEPLVDDIDIQGINNYYSAREMAKLFLLRSRLSTAIAFSATSELIELEVGDTFRITHPTPAWENKKFQVQEVGLNFDGTVEIQAIEYSADIYTYNEASKETPFIPTSLPDPNKLEPVTELTASAGSFIDSDGRTVPYIDLNWVAPNDALVDRYEIKYTIDDGTKVYSAVAIDTTHRIVDAKGSYDFTVFAVNGFGSKSTGVQLNDVVAVADTIAPSLPTSITATGGIKHITLDWTNPTEDDFDVVEIKANTVNNESTATLIATVRVDNFIHDVDANEATRYYFLRAKDRTGNASGWTTAVSGTTVKVVSGDMNVDELSDISTNLGSITGGSLDIGSGTFTVDSSGNMTATSATIEGQGTFGDGIVASSESGTLEVGRAISDGTVKVGSQLGFYSAVGEYVNESFIEFRLTDMRIFMGEGTGNFKFEGGANTGYDFERPVTFSQSVEMYDKSTSTGYTWVRFLNNNGSTQYGAIYRSYSSMFYGTSSDYRLKENVVDLTDACSRIKEIPVRRFNFIEHPDETVDGFLAHEVQAIVPESVFGEKDQVDEVGNPVYQSIDQSKLIPLLTKALQEVIEEIEILKSRIRSLED